MSQPTQSATDNDATFPYRSANAAPRHAFRSQGGVSRARQIIHHGEMSQADAEQIWLVALREWGLDSSNKDQRDELLETLTTIFAWSTSADEENLDTKFTLSDTGDDFYYSLRVLADAASVYAQSTNESKLRMFVRSFRDCYFPCNVYSLLANPANVESRSKLALRAEGPLEHAQYMFDTSDHLVNKSGWVFSLEQIKLFKRYRTTRTDAANASAQKIGLVAPKNDFSARNTRAMRTQDTIQAATTPENRTGFGNLAVR